MAPRPWRPADELEGALERGDLRYALALAEELRIDGKPIRLPVARRFLPLIAAQRPDEYDAWACRFLTRWLRETPRASIEQAAEAAATLADGAQDPTVLRSLG